MVEVASNDGYLLQYFVKRNVPVLGYRAGGECGQGGGRKRVPTLVRFFGTQLAEELAAEGRCADLVLGNNVLAQVPDLNDFVEGLKILLKPDGVLTLEFPHLLRLIEHNEFDTIYHEHFSYFSMLTTVSYPGGSRAEGFDVEELATHGGSLRVYACRAESKSHAIEPSVQKVIAEEERAGLASTEGYESFARQVKTNQVGAGGLSAHGRTRGQVGGGLRSAGQERDSAALLRHRQGSDRIHSDRSPYKQGRFLPGTHIPIYHPDRIRETKPDYVVILPWNLKDEIMEQLQFIREWGGRFVVPIPKVSIY